MKGFESLYEISNFGRIKSLYKNGYKTQHPNIYGYMNTTLCVNGKTRRISVHRLVAENFVPNPENKPEVNHIDFNRANNHADNLEWVTKKENILYSLPNHRKDIAVRRVHSTHIKGVCYHKTKQKYQVIVKTKYIGYFENLEDAIKARDKALKEYEEAEASEE